MSTVTIEQPCYTLVNLSQDMEQPSEMKLREDLEKGDNRVRKPQKNSKKSIN